MSHDAAVNRPVNESSRRRVRFQATIDDLEERVLLSGARHYIAPQVHVRVMHARAMPVRVAPVRVVHPARVRVRLPQRAAIRYGQTQSPTINVPINVQTTVAGSTNTSTATPAASSTQAPAATGTGASSSASATPSTSTPTPTTATSTGQILAGLGLTLLANNGSLIVQRDISSAVAKHAFHANLDNANTRHSDNAEHRSTGVLYPKSCSHAHASATRTSEIPRWRVADQRADR